MGWFSSARCTSTARLDGKTAVITGCNTGIGKYTVLDLYGRGARVVMACRNIEKAEETRTWVIEQKAGQKGVGELAVCHLDLSSLSSVHECAEKLFNEEMRINILINNAGVMMCPRSLTNDGYELQFATNHLGHFLFTLKLLFKIIGSGPSRIINLSSSSHHWCSTIKRVIQIPERSPETGGAFNGFQWLEGSRVRNAWEEVQDFQEAVLK